MAASLPSRTLVGRADRTSVPESTGSGSFLPIAYGDPFGDGWSTARIVSVIVPIALVIAVVGYFCYLWLARRDLVKAERARIDRRWNGSGGTVVRRKGAKAPLPAEGEDDDDDLYQKGYRPRTHHGSMSSPGTSMPHTPSQSQHHIGSSDDHTINNDSPERPGMHRFETERSTYSLASDSHQMSQYQPPPRR